MSNHDHPCEHCGEDLRHLGLHHEKNCGGGPGKERADNERVTDQGFTPLGRPWIVCAAIRYEGGLVVPSARHFDRLATIIHRKICGDKKVPHDQGFIDQWGRFYNRKDALQVALQNKQCYRNPDAVFELYSEDLY